MVEEKFTGVREVNVRFRPQQLMPVIDVFHEKGEATKEALVFQARNVSIKWLSSGITDYRLVFEKPVVCEFELGSKSLFCEGEK